MWDGQGNPSLPSSRRDGYERWLAVMDGPVRKQSPEGATLRRPPAWILRIAKENEVACRPLVIPRHWSIFTVVEVRAAKARANRQKICLACQSTPTLRGWNEHHKAIHICGIDAQDAGSAAVGRQLPGGDPAAERTDAEARALGSVG